MHTAYIVSKGIYGIFDVFGPIVEFLGSPEEPGAVFCLMRGTVPPGVPGPLHSHPDAGSFFTLSGTVQVLSQNEDRFDWFDVKSGDFVQISGGTKHAFRNTSSEPVVPTGATSATEDLQRFARVAAEYEHWLGSPEENAAVGISLFRDPTRNAAEAAQPVHPC